MSKSVLHGKAFEYAFLVALENAIKPIRCVKIKKDHHYEIAKNIWNNTEEKMCSDLKLSAEAGVGKILEVEPLILEHNCDDDIVEIKMQPDSAGENGDIRDIVIVRNKICWEIGISVKNNHFAVKHSRLSKRLDFGDKWFGIKCSDEYWKDITPIFDYLQDKKNKGLKWRDITDKEGGVYIPLLEAFSKEINKSYDLYGNTMAIAMVEYLLGKFDFYKAISITKRRVTQIQTYNLRGTLNKQSKEHLPKVVIPVAKLPSRIVHVGFKPGSNTTVEIIMDEGWQFSFRIHNASSKVETSLKFDIQIIGMPTAFISIYCAWDN